MKKINWLKLLISISICQTAGIVGSIFTTPAINSWYVFLKKPAFQPPSWLFGPVWIILYTLMGVVFYQIWQLGWGKEIIKKTMLIFIFNLVINSLWSVLFFGLKSPLLALVDIILLWLVILTLIVQFWSLKKEASYLFIPYFTWVSFATLLNFSIWQLN
jgi:benzodiazapine receptor